MYPSKFKVPTLQTFNGTRSLNQHIYYFRSQIDNVVSNDATLAHLFISILKGIAFEWFIKLSEGFIKNRGYLESLFPAILRGRLEGCYANCLNHQTAERRAYQGLCEVILDCCTLVPKRHDTVSSVGNMLTQSLDPTRNTNGGGGMLHMEAAGATWKTV